MTAYKSRLFAPGPVEVPPQVLEAMARPVIHHRTAAFKDIFVETRELLAEVATVPGDDVLMMAGTGTAAFEAGLLACVPRGAKVVGINAGKFGERWVKLARHYGYDVVEIRHEWGQAADTDVLNDTLGQHPDAAALMSTHSETSTGVLHDVETIAKVARDKTPDALFLVDCVTSLGVTEVRPHEWGLDGVFSGSQKGLMTPPGLGFAWLSERAWARSDDLNPSFYLDLRKERTAQRKGETAYTAAVSLVAGLREALRVILEEGLEPHWHRKAVLNRAVLDAGTVLGCAPYAQRTSPAVAALTAPDGVAAPDIVKGFAKRGARIAGGQDHAKPVLFRPSVMGYVDDYDAITMVTMLAQTLADLGQTVSAGEAVQTALNTMAEL